MLFVFRFSMFTVTIRSGFVNVDAAAASSQVDLLASSGSMVSGLVVSSLQRSCSCSWVLGTSGMRLPLGGFFCMLSTPWS